ncbi:hypothetical protein AMK17_12785 [Streptomyces sp. CB00072]|nr:hypothetical protein AMK17_12785 [Streptomyces sp. CB00072]
MSAKQTYQLLHAMTIRVQPTMQQPPVEDPPADGDCRLGPQHRPIDQQAVLFYERLEGNPVSVRMRVVL